MRNSFQHTLHGWELDTPRELTERIKKLERFVPLEDDELETANEVFRVWLLKMDALSQAEIEALTDEEGGMKKPSPEKEARREQKRAAKKDREFVFAFEIYAMLAGALAVGFILGYWAHLLDVMWLFQ